MSAAVGEVFASAAQAIDNPNISLFGTRFSATDLSDLHQ